MRNLKPLSLCVFFFALACQRIFIRTHNIQSRCVIGPENTARRCVHVSFSPEILQATAVKVLKNKTITTLNNCSTQSSAPTEKVRNPISNGGTDDRFNSVCQSQAPSTGFPNPSSKRQLSANRQFFDGSRFVTDNSNYAMEMGLNVLSCRANISETSLKLYQAFLL